MVGSLGAFLVANMIFTIGTALFASLVIGAASMVAAIIPVYFGSIPGLPVRAAARIRIDADRLARKAPFILGTFPAIPIGLLVYFSLGTISAVYCATVTAILGSLLAGLGRWSLPSDNAVAASPRSSLAHDRRATVFVVVASGLPLGTIIGVASSAHHGAAVGAFCAILGGLCFGVVVNSGSAYSWFVATRTCLAVTGRTPWRR